MCHHHPDITSDPTEMRKLAGDFYTQLYNAESCHAKSAEDLLEELPQLHKNTKRGIRQDNPLPGTHTGIFSAIHGTIP